MLPFYRTGYEALAKTAYLVMAAWVISCSGDPARNPDLPARTPSQAVESSQSPSPHDASPPAHHEQDTGPAAETDGVSGATIQASGRAVTPSGDLDAALFLEAQRRTIAAQRDRPVHVVRSANPKRAAEALMEKLSPTVGPDTPVLIKPNLGGFTWFRNGPDNGLRGRTTDPGFVEGIVCWLANRGVERITIGESWGVDDPAQVRRLFAVSRYDDIAKRHRQVRLVDMNYYGGEGPDDELTRPVSVPMPDAVSLKEGLVLPAIYIEHLTGGLVIDVPKLKTHQLATVTAGIKNLMGVLGIEGKGSPHRNKWMMHREIRPYIKQKDPVFDGDAHAGIRTAVESFTDRLLDAFEAAHPHLTLIDGVLAADGDGFDRTSSVPTSVAIGSYNTVYADVVAARSVGLWDEPKLAEGWIGHACPHHIQKALARFYPGVDSSRISVEGPAEPRHRARFELRAIGPAIIPGDVVARYSGGGAISATPMDDVDDLLDLLDVQPPDGGVWLMTDWKGDRLPVGIATRVWAAYSREALFFVFSSRYRSISTNGGSSEGDTPDLFKGDVVEVFLDPDPADTGTYYELELAPGGGRLDLSVDLAKGSFVDTWESGMTSAQRLRETYDGWDCVIRVPFGPGLEAKPGDRWKVNFYRTEGKGKARQYMAWRPTGSERPKFHVPEAFGTLVFGE